jgi:hypothetical protein
MKRRITKIWAYHYTYGDGSSYWDCFRDGVGFLTRCHSHAEIANLAAGIGATWSEL